MAFPLRFLWAMAAFLAFTGLAHAEPRPAVIELFTSEGCNSCPPAEAYVGELAGRSDVLALSFHVDYWDDLGWRDRYGLTQSVERQSIYARSLRLSGVYTPQVVIDGRADYVGSNRSAIDRALKSNRDGVPVSLSVVDGEEGFDWTRLAGRNPRKGSLPMSCWSPTCARRFLPSGAARTPDARSRNSTSSGPCNPWDTGTARHRSFTRNWHRCPRIRQTWPCWCNRQGRAGSWRRPRSGCVDIRCGLVQVVGL